jgi:hypothetical protein
MEVHDYMPRNLLNLVFAAGCCNISLRHLEPAWISLSPGRTVSAIRYTGHAARVRFLNPKDKSASTYSTHKWIHAAYRSKYIASFLKTTLATKWCGGSSLLLHTPRIHEHFQDLNSISEAKMRYFRSNNQIIARAKSRRACSSFS